ncbi:unnamed protein product [Meganyctiphanes norvegica]|uniref:Uncharacterized protein n=1 Tax=Meganyctiphanes norvegica TaxID=48144 RepID=A0AAV2PZC7_MEGNR
MCGDISVTREDVVYTDTHVRQPKFTKGLPDKMDIVSGVGTEVIQMTADAKESVDHKKSLSLQKDVQEMNPIQQNKVREDVLDMNREKHRVHVETEALRKENELLRKDKKKIEHQMRVLDLQNVKEKSPYKCLTGVVLRPNTDKIEERIKIIKNSLIKYKELLESPDLEDWNYGDNEDLQTQDNNRWSQKHLFTEVDLEDWNFGNNEDLQQQQHLVLSEWDGEDSGEPWVS